MKSSALPVSRLRALLAVIALAVAPAASAVPFNAYFDGPVVDGRHRGLADPTAATDAGLTLLELDVYSPAGVIEPISQSADGMVIDTVTTPAEIDSEWVIENLLAAPVVGEVWILFTSVGNATQEIGGVDVTTSYASTEVALGVDEDWVVVRTEEDGVTVHYVGFSLGSLLSTPGATTPLDVRYHLDDPEVFPDGLDTVLALPELEYKMAYQVPEPASGLLVTLGLVALASRRRSA